MQQLEGKVAIVTGAGRGLGEAICHSLAKAGVNVVAADLCADLAQKTAAAIRNGIQSEAVALDVGDEEQAAAIVQGALDRFGRLDILINNAGTDVTLSVEELQFAEWDRVIRTNLRGPFVLSKTAFPILRQQGGGHIVNIVSTAARRAWANASAYHASKCGIKVTAVICGGMRTPFLLDRFPDIDPKVLQDPRNVADTVRYVLTQPDETVIPEIMVLPVRETSWP
jgi:NADP-dependent 3-hydroxy acid dehydrogenase YdfG